MDKEEIKSVLRQLEGIHATTAQVILDLRELVEKDKRYLKVAKDDIMANLKAQIGAIQVAMDALPDLRAFAPKPEPVVEPEPEVTP